MTIFLVALSALAAPADAHEKQNPIYHELRQAGLSLGASAPIKFPAPLMADGLSSKDQQAIIRKVIGEDFAYSEFTRNSPVAPNKLVLNEITPAAPNSVTRRAEVTCIAYGDLKVIANKEFLDRVLDVNRKDGKAASVSAEKLAKRGVMIKDDKREGYAHVDFSLIDKVQLNAVGHSFWSRTDDSIVAAGHLDRRFRDDAEFPNQWRPILKSGGKKTMGKSAPYDEAAYYVKITRLAQPKGALFVEGHIIFKEPEGWFEGTNLLRSKLPPVIQKQVRDFRRELLKASEK